MKKLMRMMVTRISAENKSKDFFVHTRKKRSVLAMFLGKAYLQKQIEHGDNLFVDTNKKRCGRVHQNLQKHPSY